MVSARAGLILMTKTSLPVAIRTIRRAIYSSSSVSIRAQLVVKSAAIPSMRLNPFSTSTSTSKTEELSPPRSEETVSDSLRGNREELRSDSVREESFAEPVGSEASAPVVGIDKLASAGESCQGLDADTTISISNPPLQRDHAKWVQEVMEKSKAHFDLREHQEALDLVDRALEVLPADHVLLNFKAGVLLQLRRCNEALEVLEAGLTTNPNNYHLMLTKAQAYAMLNREKEAIATYDLVISSYPDDAEALQRRDTTKKLLKFSRLTRIFGATAVVMFAVSMIGSGVKV